MIYKNDKADKTSFVCLKTGKITYWLKLSKGWHKLSSLKLAEAPILLLLKRSKKMKHPVQKNIRLGLLQAALTLAITFYSHAGAHNLIRIDSVKIDSTELKKANALKVLQSKCNVCHKKQNPFMLFKSKNMEKRARKINKMVFVTGKMPKGEKYTLTQKEYDILKIWLNTLNFNEYGNFY